MPYINCLQWGIRARGTSHPINPFILLWERTKADLIDAQSRMDLSKTAMLNLYHDINIPRY